MATLFLKSLQILNDANNASESVRNSSSTNFDAQKATNLDDKIWYMFLFYGFLVWAILISIYWAVRYLLKVYTVINIGSNASAYQRVSQIDRMDSEEEEAIKSRSAKRLFPQDEDLELWDVEMTKVSKQNKPPRQSESDHGNYEYGLETSLDYNDSLDIRNKQPMEQQEEDDGVCL